MDFSDWTQSKVLQWRNSSPDKNLNFVDALNNCAVMLLPAPCLNVVSWVGALKTGTGWTVVMWLPNPTQQALLEKK